MAGYSPRGTSNNYKPYEHRRDVRRLTTQIHVELMSADGPMYIGLFFLLLIGFVIIMGVPLGGEILLIFTLLFRKAYFKIEQRIFDMPWRVPVHAKLIDGSNDIIGRKINLKLEAEKAYGQGVTYWGYDRIKRQAVYSTNSDDRAHATVLGTTGSGKTELLLGLMANQLVQNSGFIGCDAKGDTTLQKEVYRLARRFGRDDDLLTINFITSGRDMINAQHDKLTNTFNMMANTSSGMLIELIVNLLDDSPGSGGDMWKGRCIAFIAALTRPLVFLRDRGVIQLGSKTYNEFMELERLEELVFNEADQYGEIFEIVIAPLKSYLVTLPGYNNSPEARKKQDQKTKEQHGYIVMQLTRAINDLTFNYGHIFGVIAGDIDMFDVVLNRRIMTCPLPALERAEASLKMLGKLVVGSVKQMMAGSLGNRMEGLVREIIDSKPTNSPNAFKLFLDEWGYIVVTGASVMPAQGRSLSFSIVFSAQDFSDIKRGNENEAEATWGNTTIKAIGRLMTGRDGDTYRKVSGVAGEGEQVVNKSLNYKIGDFGDRYVNSDQVSIEKVERLPYDDLAGQENGEFTLLVSKKEKGGQTAGVQILRIICFYVAGKSPKVIRLNDLVPIYNIDRMTLVDPDHVVKQISQLILNNKISDIYTNMVSPKDTMAFNQIITTADEFGSIIDDRMLSIANSLKRYSEEHAGQALTLVNKRKQQKFEKATASVIEDAFSEVLEASAEKLLMQQRAKWESQSDGFSQFNAKTEPMDPDMVLFNHLASHDALASSQEINLLYADSYYDQIRQQLEKLGIKIPDRADFQAVSPDDYEALEAHGFANDTDDVFGQVVDLDVLYEAQDLARQYFLQIEREATYKFSSVPYSHREYGVSDAIDLANKLGLACQQLFDGRIK